jgi:hypothetical protein
VSRLSKQAHPINGLPSKKQQSRLTLQKATKVVEGKMYILPDFSLKTTLTFLVGQLSQTLRKHLQGSILKKTFG